MYIRVYEVRMRVYLCVCMRIEAAFRIFGSCVYQVFAGSVDDPPNASWMKGWTVSCVVLCCVREWEDTVVTL